MDVRPRRARLRHLLRRHFGRRHGPRAADRAAEPPRRRFRPRQGRCRTARGLPDGLFAALGESHAAGQSGHLRADARPLGAGLLDGRRRVQRPHARDARVGRFAHRPSGVLLVELSGDGLCAPYPDAGSGLWVGHDAYDRRPVRLRQQPDGTRRGVEAGALRRGRLHVEHGGLQSDRQLGAGARGTGSRGARGVPHLRHPFVRHGDGLPPRRVVGDRDVPHRRLHPRAGRGPAGGVRTGGCGARRAGGALRQPGAAGRAAAVARGVPQAGRTRAPDARSHRMLRDGRRRGVLERLRPQPDERRRPQCLRGPQVRHDEASSPSTSRRWTTWPRASSRA